MNNCCRVCISGQGTVKIFYEEVLGLPLSTRIMNCALVKVFINDGLPDMICEGCLQNLIVAYDFKQKCEESDNTLRKLFNQNNKETIASELKTDKENVLKNVRKNDVIDIDSLNYRLSDNTTDYDNSDSVLDTNNIEGADDVDCCNVKDSFEIVLPNSNKDKSTVKCKTKFKKTRKKLTKDDGNVKEKKKLICEVCSKSYSNRRQMRRHQITHGDKKRYCCRVCNKQFHFKGNLKVHERIHTGERPFLCNSCGKSFVQIAGLQRHLTTHTDDKPFVCSVCNKRFKLADTLTGHIRTHTLERPYKCDKCNKSFSHHSGLNKHLRVHTGVKNYQCSQCGKSFGRSDSLSEHLKIHTGERPYNCVTCDAAFSSKSTLRVHIRTHTSEKPYHCQYCSKSFTQSSVLGRHLRTHTGERPYKCTLCDQSFSLKVRLVEHTRSTHNINNIPTNNVSVTNSTNIPHYSDSGNTGVSEQHVPQLDNQQQTVQDNNNCNYTNTMLLHGNNLINLHNSNANNLQINTNLHLAPVPPVNLQEEHLRYIDLMKTSYYHHQL